MNRVREIAAQFVLAGVALGAGACLDQSIPVGVTIRCDPDDDSTCPSGTVCQPGLLVCVDEGELDDEPPTLALSVEPAVASRTQPLQVRVVASEPLPSPPSATLTLPDEERLLDFIARDSNPSAQDYRFEYAPDGLEPEGEDLVVRVSGVDRVGLAGEGTVTVQFDFTPPIVPPTDSAVDPLGAVVLVVAPGGTQESGEPLWRVEAPVGSMEEGAKLTLRASLTTAPFEEANARVDGSARVDVPPGLTSLWVAQRDVAGNESDIVRVREVRMIASTTPAAFESPKLTSAFAPRADAGPFAQGRVKPPYPGAELRGPMSVARRNLGVPALYQPAMVWDAARGELLLISGQPANDVDTVGTWVWNGFGWSPRAVNAPLRAGAAAIPSPIDGSILLLGGTYTYFSTGVVYESVRYDGNAFAIDEEEVSTLDGHRVLCSLFQAAYDPGRPGTLVVHGCTAYQQPGEEFAQFERAPDGEWSFVVTPPDPEGDGNPRSARGGCMAVDPVREVLVMFGGQFDDGNISTYLGDTWEWSGAGWARVAAADPSGTSAPTPRNAPFCAADPVTGEVYLGGGYSDFEVNPEARRELWRWDGASWTRLPDLPQISDYGAVAAFDARRHELVVFLQPSGAGEAQPTLVFDGAAWRAEAGALLAPGARQEPSLASHDGALYLWGGWGVDELWRYDGGWQSVGPISAATTRPDATILARGNELVLLGGYNAGGENVLRIDVDAQPAPGAEIPTTPIAALPEDAIRWTGFAAAVDPNTDVIAVVGGYRTIEGSEALVDNGSWFLSGSTWTRGPDVAPAGEVEFYSAVLAWDESASSFVLYGAYFDSDRQTATLPFTGIASLAGASWQVLEEPIDRPGSDGGTFVFDPTLDAPILIGGYGGDSEDGSIDTATLWRGDHWVTVSVVDAEGDGPLTALSRAAGAVDPQTGRVLLYGGVNQAMVPSTRTYLLDALADERPALIVDVDPALAGFTDVEALRALTLFVRAGATARDAGAGADGLAVRLWHGTRWVEVGAVDAPVMTPGDATIEVAADVAQRALFSGRVPVQLVPRGDNGADRARLAAPLVEATATFRLR